jgi:hypothetical protein
MIESAAARWLFTAVFVAAALGSVRFGRPGLAGLHHALMAVAMIWMLTALPGAAGMGPSGHSPGAMAGMPGAGAMSGSAAMSGAAGLPVPVLAVSVLCAALPWLARAVALGLS